MLDCVSGARAWTPAENRKVQVCSELALVNLPFSAGMCPGPKTAPSTPSRQNPGQTTKRLHILGMPMGNIEFFFFFQMAFARQKREFGDGIDVRRNGRQLFLGSIRNESAYSVPEAQKGTRSKKERER